MNSIVRNSIASLVVLAKKFKSRKTVQLEQKMATLLLPLVAFTDVKKKLTSGSRLCFCVLYFVVYYFVCVVLGLVCVFCVYAAFV